MINELTKACKIAETKKIWVVIVVPKNQVGGYQQSLSLFPAQVSGRTLAFPNGGKVSVAAATEPVFVPSGTPFSALFLGWGEKAISGSEMKSWREASAEVLNV